MDKLNGKFLREARASLRFAQWFAQKTSIAALYSNLFLKSINMEFDDYLKLPKKEQKELNAQYRNSIFCKRAKEKMRAIK